MHDGCFKKLIDVVQSTTSMQGMLLLGGLGACPPRKFLKIKCSEIDSGGIFYQKIKMIYISKYVINFMLKYIVIEKDE